ncbi:IucA/IucC family protein [Leisingera methylohalidivorans]|uniref:Rhizobactin siderophore biosynthesis protein RhsF n=1 Tax=Leisingera methylohalidivorans DSM 14336 TaxID=999552 RepID=V9VWK2_9RHOB|nr:IucA/IucC family protein [Leisingera methylohalidivorans]AHD02099.1 rhizobactin siderophore biosynthesis protein RhsF [Leisingera methylohalidivorans DSM 14336]
MSLHEHRFAGTAPRVLRQLCEALLSEGWAASLQTGHGRMLRWSLRGTRFRALGRRGAFDRYRLQEGSIEVYDSSGWRPADTGDVLAAVADPSPAMEILRADLARTEHLSDLNAQQIPPMTERRRLTVSALETALHEGHPYHPCFKARSGFSDADHLAYGPEAGRTFRLAGVLFHHTLVQQSLPDKDFWPQELGTAEWDRITALADQQDAPLQDFRLLPLHPWQAARLQDDPLFQDWCRTGRAVQIGPVGDPYRATQSVRTLMNADTPQRAHVKTAMAMRNTSSLRTFIPATVAIAPAISRWLADVLAGDPLFATRYRLTLLPEYAGIIAGRGTALDGHLAAIWRQSPESLGLAGDRMMPFNGLALTEPDGTPLIAPWIDRHGLDPWLDQLIEVAVLPVWHLMVAHGIGLEAHGQNLILQHDNGWPAGLIARDFHDGVEYVDALLSRPGLCPDLAQIDPIYADAPLDDYHKLSAPDGLRELVMDTLFVFNLADLSDLLQRRYGLAETAFWRRVRARLDRYAAEHGLEARQAALAPFAPKIHAESLITRKIDPGRPLYRHLITNALAPAKDC